MLSKVFEHPFDLCKVRLQTQVLDQVARFSGPIDCLTKTWKTEGFRGLYRVRVYYLCEGKVVQIFGGYMRWPFFANVGFTSANSGSDGRELVSLSIIQRTPESRPMDEPYTSTSRSDLPPNDLGRRRCWCRHELCPVSSIFSLLFGKLPQEKTRISRKFNIYRIFPFFFF